MPDVPYENTRSQTLDDGRTHFVGDDCEPPHEDVDTPSLTLDQVSGMLHKASIAKSRVDELEMTAQRDHERVDFHLAEATEVDRKLIAETIATVSEFWRKRVAAMDPGERQSVNLPWGRLEARKVGKRIECVDEIALLDWCRNRHPDDDYLRVPPAPDESPNWRKIKTDIAAGKLTDVPGVEITDDGDYTVKVTID